MATAASVVSKHGIQFVPRERVRSMPGMGRPFSSGKFAYTEALKDLASRQDAWTARFAAKRLEIRTPIRFEGDTCPVRPVMPPVFIGCGMVAFLMWLKTTTEKRRHALEVH